ncbi:hypothetical protein [Microbacterium sp. GXF6406]
MALYEKARDDGKLSGYGLAVLGALLVPSMKLELSQIRREVLATTKLAKAVRLPRKAVLLGLRELVRSPYIDASTVTGKQRRYFTFEGSSDIRWGVRRAG